MSIQEILTGGGVLVLLTLVQVAPVKLNPWSALAKLPAWLAKKLGRAINADVLKDLEEVKIGQADTRKKLEEHIKTDNERNADLHRARILQFNTELLKDRKHTEEEFNEMLYNIDSYERYCEENPDYRNNRAVHAIMNIKRVYDDLLETHDFL